jgi:hypothetical protein
MKEKLLKHILLLFQIRVGFERAMVPDDDLNTRAREIWLMDDALEMTRMSVWVWFLLVGFDDRLLLSWMAGWWRTASAWTAR